MPYSERRSDVVPVTVPRIGDPELERIHAHMRREHPDMIAADSARRVGTLPD